MPQNFIESGREHAFLMSPSLRDWVAEDRVVWTVLDPVGEMDLVAFYAAYRADGHGRPAYEPSMMVAPLLYAYARGNRSSRGSGARLPSSPPVSVSKLSETATRPIPIHWRRPSSKPKKRSVSRTWPTG